MGRRLIGCAALIFTAASTIHPAEAKDRKSAAALDRRAVAEMMDSGAVARRQDTVAAAAARSATSSAATEISTRRPNGKPIAPLADHQPVKSNPLRFNIGWVAVEPAMVGGIKGAQFSIGF